MSAMRRRCNRCGCEQATTEDWNEMPEGGGSEMCWDSGGPGCHDTRDERLASALAREGELETALAGVTSRLKVADALIVAAKREVTEFGCACHDNTRAQRPCVCELVAAYEEETRK